MYQFEYDDKKNTSNLKKHGIDFAAAQELWLDPDLIQIPANTENEPRFLIVARIYNKHWSAIITNRDSTIRIISVRRSRKTEVELYES
ncbi:MAG: BrnT family toxin [Gammaproteobacteria bacterium]|nr:BrnT family toxin [Gammaproteobacteria bacterium]